nr:Stf0 family sulfotransferase [uncultured Celeribacter sp.]
MALLDAAIILCATQRCGSTMVVEDMRNTGELGLPEEWFLPWAAEKPGINWRQALAGVAQRAQSDNGVVALKIMANQLGPVEDCLAQFMPPDFASPFGRFAQITRAAHFVYIMREDIVLQAISRLIARQTGINHATRHKDDPHFAGNLLAGYDSGYNAETHYSYEDIRNECRRITLENLLWQHFFSVHAITPLILRYEQLCRDSTMRHLDQIATLAGLPAPQRREERKMVKMGNQRNAQWRGRFFTDLVTRGFS